MEDPERALLTFVDDQGVEWEVREIRDPSFVVIPPHHLRHPEFAGGWLLFSSPSERRRLAPYPSEWLALGRAELIDCCHRARPVASRPGAPPPERTPLGGFPHLMDGGSPDPPMQQRTD